MKQILGNVTATRFCARLVFVSSALQVLVVLYCNTRGHSCKMFKKSFNLDIGKYRFSNRICLEWNSLSEDIVDAKNLNSFKDKLDRHLKTVRGFT